MAEVIEWAITPEQSPTLRRCQDVAIAVLGGLGAIALVGGVFSLALEAQQGNWTPLLLAALLALVGGPISLVYLWPMLRDVAQRPDRSQFPIIPRSPRRAIGLAAVGAVGLVAMVFIWPVAAVLIVLVVLVGLVPLVGLLRTDGSVDPNAGTISVDGRTGALAALTGSRQVPVGSITIIWLSYTSDASPWMLPRLVVCPTPVAQRIRPHITAGITAPLPATDDGRESNRTVQATLVAFGLLFLGVAIAEFFVADIPSALALWASSAMTLFALVFLWLAARE